MARTAVMNIRTDEETKALIQQAAKNLGLSLNSFVVMVAKQFAKQKEIKLDNTSSNFKSSGIQITHPIDWSKVKIPIVEPEIIDGHQVFPSEYDDPADDIYDELYKELAYAG